MYWNQHNTWQGDIKANRWQIYIQKDLDLLVFVMLQTEIDLYKHGMLLIWIIPLVGIYNYIWYRCILFLKNYLWIHLQLCWCNWGPHIEHSEPASTFLAHVDWKLDYVLSQCWHHLIIFPIIRSLMIVYDENSILPC